MPQPLKRTTSLCESPVPRAPYDTLHEREHAFLSSRYRKFRPNSLAALDLAGTDGLEADDHALQEGILEMFEHLKSVDLYKHLRIGRRRFLEMTLDEVAAAVIDFFGSHLPVVEDAKLNGWDRYRHTMLCLRREGVKTPYERRYAEFHAAVSGWICQELPYLVSAMLKKHFG